MRVRFVMERWIVHTYQRLSTTLSVSTKMMAVKPKSLMMNRTMISFAVSIHHPMMTIHAISLNPIDLIYSREHIKSMLYPKVNLKKLTCEGVCNENSVHQ